MILIKKQSKPNRKDRKPSPTRKIIEENISNKTNTRVWGYPSEKIDGSSSNNEGGYSKKRENFRVFRECLERCL